jgi:transcriptional regulator with XRE-family HTH domain
MYLSNLKILMAKRNLSQSDLATALNLSRQAVSLWLRSDDQFVNIKTKQLGRLCEVFNISPNALLTPFPVLEKSRDTLALFLWDGLYSSIEDFYIALSNKEWSAIGRLVQVWGMYRSAKVLGKIIWLDFNKYSKYIHPSKRRICEKICQQKLNLA